jgi:hypothetical protein
MFRSVIPFTRTLSPATLIPLSRLNARLYAPAPARSNIEYLQIDAYDLLTQLKETKQFIDIVLLAPPWGGVNYHSQDFDLETMLTSGSGIDLVQRASKISSKIILLIPKNTKLNQLFAIAELIALPMRVQKVALHGKVKMLVVYYGEFFQHFS